MEAEVRDAEQSSADHVRSRERESPRVVARSVGLAVVSSFPKKATTHTLSGYAFTYVTKRYKAVGIYHGHPVVWGRKATLYEAGARGTRLRFHRE